MQRTQHEVRTADGHLLLVEVAGPERGDALFFHHGTPGSRFRDDEMIEVGAERGLCHVSYSRPGYEGSDRQTGRQIVDCAHDVSAIVDQLELDGGFVVGESAGGPHALAHVASQPEWAKGVVMMVGSAPFGAEGLDWFKGMAPGNREEFDAVLAGDPIWLALLEARIEKIKAARDLREINEVLGDLYTEADIRSFEKEGIKQYVMQVWKQVAASGLWGWFDDGKALLGDWGFDLGQVEAPVAVWHGEDDRVIPISHGRWVADHLPNAAFHPLPSEGHSSFLDLYDKILGDLIASSGT